MITPSPCIGLCRMDPERDLCQGCHRTLEEIAQWGELDEEERRAVLLRVAGRKADHHDNSFLPKI